MGIIASHYYYSYYYYYYYCYRYYYYSHHHCHHHDTQKLNPSCPTSLPSPLLLLSCSPIIPLITSS